ncbi:MAG: hypothetical protein MJZ22_02980 [Candidatus Saccharibacteria bacterium]|nr:hypothetical protein [Candidatus Saccharibacteria bacterium]
MTTEKTNLKKHVCPTCGGLLKVLTDKQMYECPFCGVTFDYEYFREDDVLGRAAKFRKAGDWSAALDAYNFMLEKDPHNFAALRGKILTAAHLNNSFRFLKDDKVYTDVTAVKKAVEQAQNATDEEHREYFEKVSEFLTDIRKYAALSRDVNYYQRHRLGENTKLNSLEETEGLAKGLKMLFIILGIWGFIILWALASIFVAIAAAAIVIGFAVYMHKNTFEKEEIDDVKNEIHEINYNLAASEKELETLGKHIYSLNSEIREMDRKFNVLSL